MLCMNQLNRIPLPVLIGDPSINSACLFTSALLPITFSVSFKSFIANARGHVDPSYQTLTSNIFFDE